jgi:hypothetical protein
MIRPPGKHHVSLPAHQGRVTRRHFVGSVAALAGGVAAATAIPIPAWAAPLPPKVDLTEFPFDASHPSVNYMTPVKNQHTCNACTAFAVVAMIEGAYNRKSNPQEGDKGINLSEGQLFFAAGPRDKCAATHWWPEDALAYCAQVGLTREDEDKFVGNGNKLVRARGTKLLRPRVKETQDLMKAWLVANGPIVAVMAEYSDFFTFAGGNSVYSPGVGGGTPWFVGGHVLCIVGYDETTNPKSWICKNSYGTGWNSTATKKGYVNIAQGGVADKDCYIDGLDVWGVSII